MFSVNRYLCSIRFISNSSIRYLPRSATSNERSITDETSDYAVINKSQQRQTELFHDYNVVATKPPKIQSRSVPKSVPKLIDIQTGLNKFIDECDERMLLTTIQSKYKLFDCNNVGTFIQRLHQLNVKRNSNEQQHQRLYDFVDYFILKHGQQFDFDQVLTIYFQLASLNENTNMNSHPGSYAFKVLIQLLKHNVNKYHLKDVGRLLISLENDLGCNLREDERMRSLFDAYFLLSKFRQKELDRLDAQSLAELAYVFSNELEHVYFTNILNEYIRDEYYHDKYSTMLILRALYRRGYKHNRTLDICLHFVNENKDLFKEEMTEIKECLNRLDYQMEEE